MTLAPLTFVERSDEAVYKLYHYHEIAPSAASAHVIECHWTLEVVRDYKHLVVPDGCIDLILSWRDRRIETANIVGTMTKPREVALSQGQLLSGVRFHPGMFSAALEGLASEITDQEVALHRISSPSASLMMQALRGITSVDDCFARLEEAIGLHETISPAQHAIAGITAPQNESLLSEAAAMAALSDRQFRRVCLRETGIAPKQLQRIARFRKAWLLIHDRPGSIGAIALECGYSDHAHLIREFGEFAGMTPGSYVKSMMGSGR